MSRNAAMIALTAILLTGCGNKVELPLYGNWEGEFRASQPTGVNLRGYLQLYATNHKFKMRLADIYQSFDTTGTWALKGDQIALNIVEIKMEGISQQDAAARKVQYLAYTDVRASYGHQLVLNLTTDHKTMNGLPMTIGGLSGQHWFKKAVASSYK